MTPAGSDAKWAALTAAVGLGLWEMICDTFEVPSFFIPAPSEIFSSLWHLKVFFLKQTLITGAESITGLFAGGLLGFLTALTVHFFPIFRRTLFPILVWMQSVPKVALAPVFLIWFGFGAASKIILVALICFFPIAVNSAKGLAQCPSEVMELCTILRFSPLRRLLQIEIPFCLPWFFSGLKISCGLSVIGAVFGEFTGSIGGLGHVILTASLEMNMPKMFGSLFLLGFIGIALFKTTEYFEARILPWHLRDSNGQSSC